MIAILVLAVSILVGDLSTALFVRIWETNL